MDYLRLGYEILARHQGAHIASAAIEGQKIWVKRASKSKKTFWHILQGGCAKIFNQPMIAPTVIKGGAEIFAAEIQKLKDFKAAGILVPEVLAADSKILVMSDLGEPLDHVLNGKDAAEKQEILMQAVGALLNLHQKGLVHGKPYLRDMVLSATGEIGFLDLEENPQNFMTLPQAQARDIWLFLCFAAKQARDKRNKYKYHPQLIITLFQFYLDSAPSEVLVELQKFVIFLKPLVSLLEASVLWRKIGSDARRAVFVTVEIYKKIKK